MGRLQFAIAIAIAAMGGGAATAVAINWVGDMPDQMACSAPVPLTACPVPQSSGGLQQLIAPPQHFQTTGHVTGP